jgi:hypothetical protein
MKVWIVSKILRSGCTWVHGLTEENQNVRLLQPDGSYPSVNTKFEIGQIWNMTFQKSPQVIPPHVENMIVTSWKFIGRELNLRDVLIERVIPWKGSPNELFDGCLKSSNRVTDIFIAQGTRFPHKSMGYWLPDVALSRRTDFEDRNSYKSYEFLINYSGFAQAIAKIPENTLLHVFLNEWWMPSLPIEARPNANSNVQKRCYLQISDWYL